MRHNIVKLDSKGRVLLPYHIRELLDVGPGSEFVIISNYNGEIKLLPLLKGKTAELSVLLEDKPGNMSNVTKILAKHNINIILSQLKTIERGHIAEWRAVLDISECSNPRRLASVLESVPLVKKVSINTM